MPSPSPACSKSPGRASWRHVSALLIPYAAIGIALTAPSNLIISGRYILQPEIFGETEKQEPGAGGEIQLTDAMIRLMQRERFYGLKYRGTTYDCGDKVGFLAANVAFALEREDVGPGFREAVKKILAEKGGV
jgi:UTP--glucose-1-phosphate uridylyltransferase